MHIRPFTVPDTEPVVALWQACGLTRPWNDPRKDIERKLSVQPELFLVGEREGELVATAMAGYDGHRGWVYYVAVAPGLQRAGVGRQLMAEVEERLHWSIRSVSYTPCQPYRPVCTSLERIAACASNRGRTAVAPSVHLWLYTFERMCYHNG